jgi:PKD repeat protein
MMKLAPSILMILLVFSDLTALAQVEPCWFDHYQRQNITRIKSAEQVISGKVRNGQPHDKTADSVKVIPVVVHVIHNGGTENISASQVQSQIDVLNEDFRKKAGTNGFGSGVDTRIEFCLAKKDPSGHCTDGIVRVQSSLTNHLTYQRSHLKLLSFWDNKRYLNMYVVKTINGNSGIAGYSSFPGGPDAEDGIVVRYNYFGRTGPVASGSNGRTTSHEIGHWFGLYHTFQDGCGTDTCTDGDKVCDTPPVASPNYGCPTNVNSCTNDVPNLPDQIANYLDYSDDACKHMFTAGQRTRMHATLSTFRSLIWSQNNLIAVGCDSGFVPPTTCLPKAGITALKRDICVTGSVVFSSVSLNGITGVSWSFPGGTPATSTLANPTVVYNATGSFPVRLKVQNSVGSDSLEITDYVQVSDPDAGMPNTWGHNFESPDFPNNGLQVDNPDTTITWERTTDAAKEGAASVRIQNLINTNYGQSDALVFPRIDFTALQSPIRLGFKWAYARSDPSYSDELIVLVSKDCGSSWTQRFYRTGTSLTTAPTQTTLFIPTTSQWKTANIDLSTYAGNNHVDIKIVNVTDGGNALYIDSLKLGDFDFGSLTSIQPDKKTGPLFRVYPNPAGQEIWVECNPETTKIKYNLKVLNALGQTVLEARSQAETKNRISLEALPSGIYTLWLGNEQGTAIKKIMKQ